MFDATFKNSFNFERNYFNELDSARPFIFIQISNVNVKNDEYK